MPRFELVQAQNAQALTDCSARMPEQLAQFRSRPGVIHSDCAEVVFECVRCSQCLRNGPAAIRVFAAGPSIGYPRAQRSGHSLNNAFECVAVPRPRRSIKDRCLAFISQILKYSAFSLVSVASCCSSANVWCTCRSLHVSIQRAAGFSSDVTSVSCLGPFVKVCPFLRFCRRAAHVLPAAASRDCSTRTGAVLVRSALQRRVSILMSPHMSVDCLQTRVSPGCDALLGLILARPRGDCTATVQASATLCIAALAASASANKGSVTAINGRIESTGLCAVSPLSFSVCISPNAPTAPQFSHER